MQILIDIPKETYEYWKTHRIEAGEYVLTDAVRTGIVIPDNAKNGDVLSLMMFKELTGDISHLLEIDDYDRQTLEKEWLNAPYKRGDENADNSRYT